MFANVIVNIPSSNIDQMFEYLVPEPLTNYIMVGSRVSIPFGQGDKGVMGYVLELYPNKRYNGEVKPIIELLDLKPVLTIEQLNLASFIKEDTISPMCRILNMMIPPALKTKTYKYLKLKNIGLLDASLSTIFKDSDIASYENIKNIKKEKLDKAIETGAIELIYNTKQNTNYLYIDKYYLNIPYYLDNINLIKEDNVKDFLQDLFNQELILSKKEILASYDISLYKINKLIKNNYLLLKRVRELRIKNRQIPVLNRKIKDETALVNDINKINKPILFIPSSKEEEIDVVISLINDIINNKKQNVVIFTPYILSSIKLSSIIRKTFNIDVACLNSELSSGEYLDYYTNILDDLYPVIVTTPVAAFLPYQNVGMYIMLDEESDNYYNDQSPRYSLHKILYYLSSNYHIPFITSSISPSVESYCYGLKNTYFIIDHSKEERNSNVIVADLKEEIKRGNNTYLSNILVSEMDKKLVNNEQILLLINNTNYASFRMCRNCGDIIKCPKCNLSLNYNEKHNILICPSCGYKAPNNNICQNCGSDKLWYGGFGKEQLIKNIKNVYPNKRILDLDDNNFNTYLESLDIIDSLDTDIIITTDKIARGAIDKKMGLVGIINLDVTLKTPSYDANSKTYTMLVNAESYVKDDGALIVQTSYPNIFVLNNFIAGSYSSFIQNEIGVRKASYLEPFYHINRIIIKSKRLDSFKIASDIVFTIKNLCGNKVFIPGYAYSKIDQGVVITIKHQYAEINQIYKLIYEKFQKEDVLLIFDKYPKRL